MKKARCRSRAATSCARRPFSTCSGCDALRYFLLREIVFGQDGSFSFDALVQRYNADLANGLGNLASRTLTMITRYFKGEVPYPSRAAARVPQENAIADTARQTIAEFNALFEQRQFSRALEVAWGLVGAVDKYIVENQPWALGEKQDDESRSRLATILYTSAEALRIVTALAHPVIPEATAKIWAQLGLGDIRKFPLSESASGDSSSWGRSSARYSPSFRAPTRARSKGCSKWKSRDAAATTPCRRRARSKKKAEDS